MVRKLEAVPSTTVTFIATAVALDGMVQLPLWPCTACVMTPPLWMGDETGPTLSGAGRVSKRRQGAVGTSIDGAPSLAPRTIWNTPIVLQLTAAATTIASVRFT
jgi:hypothetical protein